MPADPAVLDLDAGADDSLADDPALRAGSQSDFINPRGPRGARTRNLRILNRLSCSWRSVGENP